MAIQTWKNGRFFKNIMKVLKRIVEKYEIIVRPLFMKDFIGRIIVDSAKEIEGAFEDAMTSKEIRDVYKKYSKALHPDLNGNTIGNVNGMRYLNPDMGNMMIADKYGWEWLCATRDAQIEMIEFWSDLDDEF